MFAQKEKTRHLKDQEKFFYVTEDKDHKINLKLYSTQHSNFWIFRKFVKKVKKMSKTGECKNMSNIPRCRNYRPCRSIISLLVALLGKIDFLPLPKKHQKVRLINILDTWRF